MERKLACLSQEKREAAEEAVERERKVGGRRTFRPKIADLLSECLHFLTHYDKIQQL